MSLNFGLDFGSLDFGSGTSTSGNIRYEVSSAIPTASLIKNGELVIWESDQVITSESMTTNMLYTDTFTGTAPLKQSFKIGAVGSNKAQFIDNITFTFKRIGDATNVIGYCDIYNADGSGNPTGNVLSSGVFTKEAMTTSFGLVTIYLTPPFYAAPNTTYCIRLRTILDDVDNYFQTRSTTNTYSGGNAKTWNGTAWVALANANNLYFNLTSIAQAVLIKLGGVVKRLDLINL